MCFSAWYLHITFSESKTGGERARHFNKYVAVGKTKKNGRKLPAFLSKCDRA